MIYAASLLGIVGYLICDCAAVPLVGSVGLSPTLSFSKLSRWASLGCGRLCRVPSRVSLVGPHTRLIAEPPPWASFGHNVSRPLSSRTSSVWHYFLLIAKPPLHLFSGSRDPRLPLLPAPLDRHLPILAADSPLLPPADRVDHRYACPGPLASGSLPVTPSATAGETGTSPELATPPTPAPKPGPRIELRDGSSPPTAPPQPATAGLPGPRLKPPVLAPPHRWR